MKELFQNLDFWSVLGTFSAVLIALIITIWGDWLKSLFFKPKLEFIYDHKWPDALKIPLNQMNSIIPNSDNKNNSYGICYLFRIRIKNAGNKIANDVEVIVKNIEQKNDRNKFNRYNNFIPLNLWWSFGNGEKYIDRINPGMEKYCDLGYILHPQQKQIIELMERGTQSGNDLTHESNILFIMSYVIKPNKQQNYALPPGHYRIELVASASNAKMKTRIFELKFVEKCEEWFDDSDKMLSSVSIK